MIGSKNGLYQCLDPTRLISIVSKPIKFWSKYFVKNNLCLFKKNWVKKLFGRKNLGKKKYLGQKISGKKPF